MNNKTDYLNLDYLSYHAEDFPLNTTALTYFALTDTLISHAARADQPIIYFWPTDKLIFLGMIDTKLPYLNEALQVFDQAGYQYIVRNSGGLAVVSDPGILNFSIIYPESDTYRLSINDAYERMHEIISRALAPYGVKVTAEEVPDSYCPGDYDLSINGRKIAGISQRRIKGGIAIMIYISMDGIQDERSNLIKEFYQKGLKDEEVRWHYPNINPEVMTSVSAEIKDHVSVDHMVQLIKHVLKDTGSLKSGEYSKQMMADYREFYDRMVSRNQKMLGDLFDEKEHLHET